MSDRAVTRLAMAFDSARRAIQLDAAPGPVKARELLLAALDDASALGDVSGVLAGARWWALVQLAARRWIESAPDTRAGLTTCVSMMFDILLRWQTSAIDRAAHAEAICLGFAAHAASEWLAASPSLQRATAPCVVAIFQAVLSWEARRPVSEPAGEVK